MFFDWIKVAKLVELIFEILIIEFILKKDFRKNEKSFSLDGNVNPAVAVFAKRKSQQQIAMDSWKMVG